MAVYFRCRVLSLLSRIRYQNFFLYFILYLLFLTDCANFHENKPDDYLLCKYCGADVADLYYAITIPSPASLKTENQTRSGKLVTIQTVKNPSGQYFDIITVKKSNCVGFGEWSKADSWFPGYAWKVCICQPWNHFLGWVFEPHSTAKEDQRKASEKGFYALVVENMLTEHFSNSLLVIPKSFSS